MKIVQTGSDVSDDRRTFLVTFVDVRSDFLKHSWNLSPGIIVNHSK